ncbi:hypothetical protein [Streptomyces sp. NPDC004629]|uniref:hypothetical protein n=1 Tax=Streptomyces sp. NPDC004629 TaxID=3364705 RepID=UPI00368D3FEA
MPLQIPPTINAFGVFAQEPCDFPDRSLDFVGLFVFQAFNGVSRGVSQCEGERCVDRGDELLQSTPCGTPTSPVQAVSVGSKIRSRCLPGSMYGGGVLADVEVVDEGLAHFVDVRERLSDRPAIDSREPREQIRPGRPKGFVLDI